MTAVLLTPLNEQFFDNNGVPLNGGKIFSYLAGTTTPQATYTDASGTVPAANPVIMDSAGRANIWGSGTYKFIITDSAGVQVGPTLDNVTAIFGSGDMTKAIYDPANIAQQVVGTGAVQTITNKTFVAPVLGAATATSINFGGSSLSTYAASTSFVPVAIGGTTPGAGTYTHQIGTYTQIGDIKFFNIYLGWSAHTGTGSLIIDGLPGAATDYFSASVYYSGLLVGASKQLTALVQSGATRIQLIVSDPAGAAAAAVAMDTVVSEIVLTGFYR